MYVSIFKEKIHVQRVIEGYQEASEYQNINAFFAHKHEQYTKKFHD